MVGLQRILVVALLVAAGPSAAGPLEDLARRTEAQGQVAVPLRADIEATIDDVAGERKDSITLFVRQSQDGKGVDIVIDLAEAGRRYLVLADGSAHAAGDGKVEKVGVDTPLHGSNWTLEDFRPFTVERCGVMRSVDESTRQITVLCNPPKGKEGQYLISVYKVDRDKTVPTQVLYYKERQDNLVKMLKNDDFELVGRKWRPKRMEMRDFRMNTRDVFEASWTQDPSFPPELFDPRAFASAKIPERG